MKHIIVAGICCLFLGARALAQYQPPQPAQNAGPQIVVKKIDASLSPAPRYSPTGQTAPTQSAPTDANRKWLVVEAELDTMPDWADEVTLRFYVVINYGSAAKSGSGYDVLTTTVTVVNMPRNHNTGKKNIVPVFLDGNTVRKYGANGIQQLVPEVAVEVTYKGVLQGTWWMKTMNSGRFWEKKPPRPGVLLNLDQSPWMPGFIDYYEQVKPSASARPSE